MVETKDRTQAPIDREELAKKKDGIVEFFSNIDAAKVSKDTVELYNNQLAENYEDVMDAIKFADPHYTAKAVIQSAGENKDALILDVGCGQGAIGDLLVKEGLTNLYGIDGSSGMLDRANKKGIYKETHELLLGISEMPDHFKDKFDIACTAGCFNAGHFPDNSYEIMLTMVKVGGLLLCTMEDIYVDGQACGCDYKSNLDKLIADKTVELVDRVKFKKYEGYDKEKSYGMFEENGGSVLIIKKLK